MLASLLAVLLAVPLASAQGVVDLRASARIEPGAAVTLADVAEVSDPDQLGLGDLVVIEDPAGAFRGERWGEVGVDQIRDLVRDRFVGELVLVRGRVCAVGIRASLSSADASQRDPSEQLTEPGGSTVRDHVLARLRSLLDASEADLRVEFPEGDLPFLARSTIGTRVTVQPLGVSRRIPLRITIYDSAGRITDGVVRPDVLVQREGPAATRTIRRGDVIDADSVAIESRWISPDVEVATGEQAIGSEAASTIRKGEIVTARAVRPPLLIEEGQLVKVHCVVGGIVVETEARALEDGRLGETIRFEPKRAAHPGDRQVFEASVSGRGRAVILEDSGVKEPES